MLKKLKRFTGIFLIMTQLFNITSIYADEVIKNKEGVILVNDYNIYEKTIYYKDNLLGIAGGFNLVGLNSVKNSPNVKGNVLTNTLIYGGNFGTTGVKEVSYFKHLIASGQIQTAGHEDSILVVGSSLNIGTADNGNSWTINGIKVDNPRKANKPDSLWQDDKREFIDLDKVKQEVTSLANQLSELENKGTIIYNADENNQRIEVSGTELFAVYNMNANDLRFDRPINIKGFNKEQVSTLIINVDMNKMNNKNKLQIPKSIAHYTDGTTVKTGAVTSWSNANVIWNIYDSSNQNKQYIGAIENTDAVTGTILSPGATVTVNSDLNGTIIAKDIIVGNGSTFRDDYVDLELKGITLDPRKATLRVGQTLTFTVITNPLNMIVPNLQWSSDNPLIASVDENGNVLARKQGEAVITVTTEGGLKASSDITVKSLITPPNVSEPGLAGHGFVHPLSVARMMVEMVVENDMSDAKLTMSIPDIGLLFSTSNNALIKVNGNKLTSGNYNVSNNAISIKLGDLTGNNDFPGIYNLEVYVRMNPSSQIRDINNYNTRVNIGNEKLIVSNKLESFIEIGESSEEITFELEPYNLELIKIPIIN